MQKILTLSTMASNNNIPNLIFFLVKVLVCISIGYSAWIEINSYSIQNLNDTKINHDNSRIPGTIRLSIIDSDSELKIVSTLNPVLFFSSEDSTLSPNYQLLKLDYRPIYNINTFKKIEDNLLIGEVIALTLKKFNHSIASGEPMKVTTLRVVGFKLLGLSDNDTKINLIIVWILGISGIISVGFMISLIPFLVNDFRRNYPMLIALASFLCFCFLQFWRLINYEMYWNNPIEGIGNEKIALTFSTFFLILISISGAKDNEKKFSFKLRRLNLQFTHRIIDYLTWIPAGVSGIIILNFVHVSSGLFNLISTGLILLFSIGILKQSIFFVPTAKNRLIKFVGYFSVLLNVVLIFSSFLNLFVNIWKFDLNLMASTQWLLMYVSIILSVLMTIYKIFIFGKTALKVLQAFCIVPLLCLLFCIYLGNVQSYLINALFVFTTVSTSVLSAHWGLKKLGIDYSKIFVPGKSDKNLKWNTFIRNLPRMINANEIIIKLENSLQDYLSAERVIVWSEDNFRDEIKPCIPKDPEILFDLFLKNTEKNQGYDVFWSRSKELSYFNFEDKLETSLLTNGWALLFPIRKTSAPGRLLFISAKKNGDFTFEDIDFIQSGLESVRLSFEILALLEKEKVLIEKTMEANLTALRAQINPHFLFNTFNSISELIHDHPIGAEEALEKLAFILRYTLKSSKENFALIKDELKLVKYYLDIEQIRFGNRLKVEINSDPNCNEIPIPSFILQTIIENCIKHGIAKIKQNGIIKIDIKQINLMDRRYTFLQIYDNGPGIDLKLIYRSTGITNTTERLKNLYERDDLIKFENTGNGTIVKIFIPEED